LPISAVTDSNGGLVRTVTVAGPVSITASDDSSITAHAIAATATVAAGSQTSGGGSLVAAVVLNSIHNPTRAVIDGVNVSTSSGGVTVTASSSAAIEAVGVAAAVGGGG